ncbi:MAG: ATP-binding protein [candidate division KSB1 bacterium]|nr:ATP-binding protein [candidate division KSB1 bacterium]MDZ7365133.1 ATP-binding protein [candidate division KSB1 bacterium]MDZ7404343.1 ATP-binding protein [candidate division KSB1 bacterium]
MTTEQLLHILYDWNFWNRPIQPFVGHYRAQLDELIQALRHPEIKVLTGIRRAGKTTLMYQVMNHLMARQNPPVACLYVNFEEPAFLTTLTNELLGQIYRVYRERIYPAGQSYIFFDEIQHVPSWERWVRAEYDKKTEAQIFISGSNSSLMQSEYSSLLTGRNLSFQIRPFDFREFLKVRAGIGSEPDADYFSLARQKTEIKFQLVEYLKWGGFPATLGREEPEKKQLLKQYFDDIINKDIIARHQIRETFGLKRLAAYLMQNTGNLLSLSALQKSVMLNKDTNKEFLSYFEDAYLLYQALFFSYSSKNSMSYSRKIYACDPGLRNAVSYSFTKDWGRLAKNQVYLKLRDDYEQVFYWKQSNEVDFVAVQGNRLLPIQVCYSDAIPEREFKGLARFMNEFKVSESLLISEDKYGEEKIAEGKIHIVPLWYFLMK